MYTNIMSPHKPSSTCTNPRVLISMIGLFVVATFALTRSLQASAPPDYSWAAPRDEAAWRELHTLLAHTVQHGAETDGLQLLFYGDSITEALRGTSMGKPTATDVPEAFLPLRTRFRTEALAIAGDQTSHLMWRLLDGESPHGTKAAVAVVLIGTNDLGYAVHQARCCVYIATIHGNIIGCRLGCSGGDDRPAHQRDRRLSACAGARHARGAAGAAAEGDAVQRHRGDCIRAAQHVCSVYCQKRCMSCHCTHNRFTPHLQHINAGMQRYAGMLVSVCVLSAIPPPLISCDAWRDLCVLWRRPARQRWIAEPAADPRRPAPQQAR